MKIEIPNKVLAGIALGGACFGAGLVVAAADFPTLASSLTYSGRLTDDAGNPRTGIESISVTLFDAESGGQGLCAGSVAAVNLGSSQGRFAVPLPQLCATALTTEGDAWAEVEVGATKLPRQRIGAVPFALVAREAQTADSARAVASGVVGEAQLAPAVVSRIAAAEAATGAVADDLAETQGELQGAGEDLLALTTRVDDVEGDVGAAHSRIDEVAADLDALSELPHARWSHSATLSNTTLTQLSTKTELVDLASEYDAANGLFKPSRAGLYLITGGVATSNVADRCGATFQILREDSSPLAPDAGPQFMANQSLASGSNNLAGAVSYVVQLAPGDELSFWAQVNCAPTTVNADIQATFLR